MKEKKQKKTLNVQFPEKLGFLFQPMRYKVCYGGRGGGRSWGYARALLLKAYQKPLRILCAREIQRSIKDSVHKLLSDQIELMGLGSFYDIQDVAIRGRNGTEFIFAGLSTQTAESIKSMEGIDIVWCEEAHVISKKSWDILIPTIRKDDSEIWITFNPSLESDEVYQRWVVNSSDNCINAKLNYRDNPWFPTVLEKERLHCKKVDPRGYPNIWGGKCKAAVEGAIYYDEIITLQAEGRICNVPYDPLLKVHVVLDLGWEDSLAAGLVQKHISEIRVIEYLEVSHTGTDVFSNELRRRPYNWGRIWLPHDGFSGSLNTKGKSTYDIFKALGWDVATRGEIAELSVEEGIRNARLMFGRFYFDQTKCNAIRSPESITRGFNPTELHWRLIECLKRHRRHISQTTQAPMAPIRDAYKHGGDMFRYICANAGQMINENEIFIAGVPGESSKLTSGWAR